MMGKSLYVTVLVQSYGKKKIFGPGTVLC